MPPSDFHGNAFVPPKAAPLGLVLFASLFDRIAIVCYENTCDSQRQAWPRELQPRLRLIDSAEVNKELNIPTDRMVENGKNGWRRVLCSALQPGVVGMMMPCAAYLTGPLAACTWNRRVKRHASGYRAHGA